MFIQGIFRDCLRTLHIELVCLIPHKTKLPNSTHMGFSNLYSYEIGGVGVFVFLHIVFFVDFLNVGVCGKIDFSFL